MEMTIKWSIALTLMLAQNWCLTDDNLQMTDPEGHTVNCTVTTRHSRMHSTVLESVLSETRSLLYTQVSGGSHLQ